MDDLARQFGAGPLLGKGGEARVYALGEDRVLRVTESSLADLTRRRALLDGLSPPPGSFAVPQVLDQGEAGGPRWVIEGRLPGTGLDTALSSADSATRAALIRAYLEAAEQVGDLASGGSWRELCFDPAIEASSGEAFHAALANRSFTWAGIAELCPALPAPLPLDGPPALVHLDYFPGNVMAEGGRITAVIDWGYAAVMADRRLTPLVAAISLELRVGHVLTGADQAAVEDWLGERGLLPFLAATRQWLASYWVFAAANDPTLADWALPTLGLRREDGGRIVRA